MTVHRNVYHPYSRTSTLTLGFKAPDLARHLQDPTSSIALDAHAADLASWNECIPAGPVEAWDWCIGQSTETLLAVLALYSAMSVDAVYARDDSGSVQDRMHEEQLAQALALDMTTHWQPTAAFMARLRKPVLAAALVESGNPALAADMAVLKKPAAAAKAAEALSRAGWLPPVLRTAPQTALVDEGAQVAPAVDEIRHVAA